MATDNSKARALRARLDVGRPAIAMAAHNPLSAKLAAAAGFDAIWASGFELSAAYAVPDAGVLSMDTHLAMMRAMGEAQDSPVIADIDTGFGNAVNVAYAVPRYAAAGAAAAVMEDKTFPKDSSLRAGGRQALISVVEFQGKIAAAKAAGGVLVVARTEALIAGLGEAEALRRGAAYVEAGADALLVHSKQITPDEILSFCAAWRGAAPLVLVPTAYPQLSFADIAALNKVGLIICGNHAIRAAVSAMQDIFRRILADGGLAGGGGRYRHGRGRFRPAGRRAHAGDRGGVSAVRRREVNHASRHRGRTPPGVCLHAGLEPAIVRIVEGESLHAWKSLTARCAA